MAVTRAPHLDAVLARVRPGRSVRLYLSADQKSALADCDGQIACRVLRALQQARHEAEAATGIYSFPLTSACFAAIARRLGTPVGITRARINIRRLIECGVLVDAGSYRSRYKRWGDGGGHRVRVFKLGTRIGGLRSALCPKPAVVSSAPVKGVRRRRCWEHALFGSLDGLPPPQLTRRQRRIWRSADERMATWH